MNQDNPTTRIVVTQDLDLFPDQLERLKTLGEVKVYNDLAEDYDAWLDRVQGFDVICSGKFGLKQKIYELEDVFISLPFVGTGWIDTTQTAANNVVISNSPGCNKDAVSEWIIMMLLAVLRRLPRYMNALDLPKGVIPLPDKGASQVSVAILGAGDIGLRTGEICEALDMNVCYFRRGDDLHQAVKDSDVVINTLSLNPTTKGLLNEEFFSWFKPGAYFVSVTSSGIYDIDALTAALDTDKLAGAAIDCGSIQVGDTSDPYYQRLAKQPKVIATPHIAYNTERTSRVGNDMMIDNIAAYLNGKPINLVGATDV
jgi:glycerate dehydrogenase